MFPCLCLRCCCNSFSCSGLCIPYAIVMNLFQFSLMAYAYHWPHACVIAHVWLKVTSFSVHRTDHSVCALLCPLKNIHIIYLCDCLFSRWLDNHLQQRHSWVNTSWDLVVALTGDRVRYRLTWMVRAMQRFRWAALLEVQVPGCLALWPVSCPHVLWACSPCSPSLCSR